MDIEKVITEIHSGREERYAEIVREFQGRIRAFIAAYCPDRNQVDEVAQSTFVWAYGHLDQYRSGTRFYAWLKAIARKKLLAELEVQKREAENRQKYLDYLQAVHSNNRLSSEPDNPKEDLAAALRKCIEKIPSSSRSLVKRRYEEQESISVISKALNKTENVVKVMLFRVRQMLKKCVEGVISSQV